MKDGSEIIGMIRLDQAKIPYRIISSKKLMRFNTDTSMLAPTDLNFTLKTGCIVYTFSKFP